MITEKTGQEQDAAKRRSQLEDMQVRHHKTCPVCGGTNTCGLNVAFEICEDGAVETTIRFQRKQEGFIGHVHGGMIATVLDGAMTNCLFSHGIAAVTGEMTLRILRPVPSRESFLVRAWIEKDFEPLYVLSAELSKDNCAMARAKGKFVNRSYGRTL